MAMTTTFDALDFLDIADENFDRHIGEVIGIKYGAEIIENDERRALLMRKTRMARLFGAIPFWVNGGGKLITQLCEERGIETRFDEKSGERICDTPEIIKASEDALNRITQNLAAEYNALCKGRKGNLTARGISASYNGLVWARRKHEGTYTGDVVSVDGKKFKAMIHEDPDRLLVLNSICRDVEDENGVLNVNADYVAAELAIAANASRLILCTNTPGVLDKDKNSISKISPSGVRQLIKEGVIQGGMIPKVLALLNAIEHGVKGAVILDPPGLVPELFTSQGAGTLIEKGAKLTLRAA